MKRIPQVSASASDAYVSVTPGFFTFDSSNWDSAQTFTVNGVDDEVADAVSYTATISHVASSSDELFNAGAPTFFPSSEVRFNPDEGGKSSQFSACR